MPLLADDFVVGLELGCIDDLRALLVQYPGEGKNVLSTPRRWCVLERIDEYREFRILVYELPRIY